SVLLLQAEWQQDFYRELYPWHNYVPVAPDLSDLFERRAWLEAHPDRAHEIGRKGQELARTWLTPKAIEGRFTDALSGCTLPEPV
ncbi:MAG: glycosyl transferase family 90, partial [Pseudomonadota bacterium]